MKSTSQSLIKATCWINEYVEQFEEYRIRSNATEDQPITLSRFRKGLNYDLQRELVARQISTLDDAYTLVQDLG